MKNNNHVVHKPARAQQAWKNNDNERRSTIARARLYDSMILLNEDATSLCTVFKKIIEISYSKLFKQKVACPVFCQNWWLLKWWLAVKPVFAVQMTWISAELIPNDGISNCIVIIIRMTHFLHITYKHKIITSNRREITENVPQSTIS